MWFAVLAAGMSQAACNDKAEPGPRPDGSLTVVPRSLAFEAKGGTETFTVRAGGLKWEASAEADWLTVSGGAGRDNGDFTVTAAPNPSAEVLSAAVVVTALTADGVEPVVVSVTQKGAEDSGTVFDAAQAEYLGDCYSCGLDNIVLRLTDMALSDGQPVPPGSILSLDLNIRTCERFGAAEITGPYEAETAEKPSKPSSFNTEVSCMDTYDAAGNLVAQRIVTGGALVIDGSRGGGYTVGVALEFSDGSRLDGSFAGLVPFYDSSECATYSNLEEDAVPRFDRGEAAYYGDAYKTGGVSKLLRIDLTEASSSRKLTLWLNLPPSATGAAIPEGGYPFMEGRISDFVPEAFLPFTARPGYMKAGGDGAVFRYDSWYEDGSSLASLRGGAVAVRRSSEGYTVEFDCTDDTYEPHRISGLYEGPIPIKDLSGELPTGEGPIGITAGSWNEGREW